MFRTLLRSVFLLLLASSLAGSVTAAFDLSSISEAIQRGPAQGLESLSEAVSGTGGGFYLSIYEDTIRQPNRAVEDAIKQRFGLDYQLDLAPPDQNGQFIFTDFFRDPWASPERTASPSIADSLRSDCVRISAARADDEARRWRIVRKRLDQRQRAFESPVSEISPEQGRVNREVLLRLIDQIDDQARAQVDQAIDQIPAYRSLTDQEQLFRCYQDLSRDASFELRLQSILNPSRKQLEALQTFVNGQLDDFSHQAVGTDVTYASSFPKYDLLFDIGVIEMLIFGLPVSTRQGSAARSNAQQADPSVPSPRTYQQLQDVFPFAGTDGTAPELRSRLTATRVRTSGEALERRPVDRAEEEDGELRSSDPTDGFGSSSQQFSGPYCEDPQAGIDLQYVDPQAEEDPEEAAERTAEEAAENYEDLYRRDEDERVVIGEETTVTPGEGEEEAGVGAGASRIGEQEMEGRVVRGKNKQQLCEGPLSVDFGNDLLRLLFCIDVEFAKVGKQWESVRDQHCIACHIDEMNRVFEQLVFESSVRPHKNTGTIMESGICEDGFGDDIGFHFFLEWVPVRFYPDICYPTGGVTQVEFAEYVGYPELYGRLNRPGLYIECDQDFRGDQAAVDRCREALGNRNRYSYEELKAEYLRVLKAQSVPLSSIDEPWTETLDEGEAFILRDGIQELDAFDPDQNVWVRLVGAQGVAEAQLHFFLYRQGKARPRFDEDEEFPRDFEARLQYLRDTTDALLRDDSLRVTADADQKMEQLLCLKGYFYGEQQSGGTRAFQCRKYQDSYRRYEDDISAERDRIERLTGLWNQRSRDFNGENSCQVFSGSGAVDAFWDTFEGAFSGDYYLETDARRTQSPEQQVTAQIQANTDLEDVGALFSEIERQVQFMNESQDTERQVQQFQTEQERQLALLSAFAVELTAFRSNVQAMTNWWADMVDKKQFVSKGGQRINVLQSFLEKLR